MPAGCAMPYAASLDATLLVVQILVGIQDLMENPNAADPAQVRRPTSNTSTDSYNFCTSYLSVA
jgi:ubiquitin-protein ligase